MTASFTREVNCPCCGSGYCFQWLASMGCETWFTCEECGLCFAVEFPNERDVREETEAD